MPELFPSVAIREPLRRTVSVPSRVLEFVDGSEQRWRTSKVLNAFDIQISAASWTDLLSVRNWFEAIEGAFDSTWSLTLDVGSGAQTFTNMALQGDELAATEDQLPGLFSIAVSVRQTRPSGTWPTVSAVFPSIVAGVVTQMPYTAAERFLTVRNDLPCGLRYANAERTALKHSWVCSYPSIQTSEMLTLLNFAVASGGRYRHFSFTEPETGTVYPTCRLDVDSIQIDYTGPNQCSMALPIFEIAA